MKNKIALLGILLMLIGLSACEQTPKGQGKESSKVDSTQPNNLQMATEFGDGYGPHSDTSHIIGKVYRFSPTVSTLTGTLNVEMFYGPPNFGDNPESDAKEYCFILKLNKAISVINEQENEGFDVSTMGVKKIQLAFSNVALAKSLKGKKIKVTGILFGKETGHHHTDILMSVDEVSELVN
jgi:hypothetical protein